MSLQELAAKFTEVKAKMMAEGQAALKEEFQKCFDAYPEITVIKWSQYTPWFNDGETCEFNVNSFVISNAPDSENVSAWGDYEGDHDDVFAEELWGESKNKYPLIADLERFCNTEIGEDIMLSAFDNHVIVTATRAGFEVEEYEHD